MRLEHLEFKVDFLPALEHFADDQKSEMFLKCIFIVFSSWPFSAT